MVSYSKKGQIGLMEMIMVLLIISIILALALTFYFKFLLGNIREKGERLALQEADVLLASISSMPELQCSFKGQDDLCLDVLKLSSFNELINREENRLYYSNIFGKKNIRVEQIYPQCNDCRWNIYLSSRADEEHFTVSTPVSLFFQETREETRDYRIGRLVIEVYE